MKKFIYCSGLWSNIYIYYYPKQQNVSNASIFHKSVRTGIFYIKIVSIEIQNRKETWKIRIFYLTSNSFLPSALYTSVAVGPVHRTRAVRGALPALGTLPRGIHPCAVMTYKRVWGFMMHSLSLFSLLLLTKSPEDRSRRPYRFPTEDLDKFSIQVTMIISIKDSRGTYTLTNIRELIHLSACKNISS